MKVFLIGFFRISGYIFIRIEDEYKNLLHFALSHRPSVIILGIVILMDRLFSLFLTSGSELMPASDEGEVRINAEMQVGTRLGLMDEKFKLIEEIVKT